MQRCVPPAGATDALPPAHERAIERIREALQRGNYALCIDSPETIGRPQTVHHGIPRLTRVGADAADPGRVMEFGSRVEGFFRFLKHLIAHPVNGVGAADIGESYLCVAFAPGARDTRFGIGYRPRPSSSSIAVSPN